MMDGPLGSSASRNKIMGVYYSIFSDMKICALQCSIQLLALLDSKDIKKFGLNKCLEPTINDLKNIVSNGVYDEYSGTTLQCRVVSCLGDNLEQNQAILP